jgi:hypothetical protein
VQGAEGRSGAADAWFSGGIRVRRGPAGGAPCTRLVQGAQGRFEAADVWVSRETGGRSRPHPCYLAGPHTMAMAAPVHPATGVSTSP